MERMMSIMLCTNRVCAGTFVDHEWVSASTIFQHVEEVIGMVLDYKIGIPCVVQRCMLWFSAPTRLNLTLVRQDQKIVKLEESTHRGRACWHRWQRSYSEHTESEE